MKLFSQRGGVMIAFGVLLAVLVMVVVIGASSYVSAANYGNQSEQLLKAKVQDNENIYAQGTQAVMEIAQIPNMYKNDLLELVKADIQGRYGKDGSQATFQFLKERQLNLDPSMYKQIQQQIMAFRNKFELAQREQVDIRRSYETALGNVWSGFWLRLSGYPKVKLSDFDIVTTDKARETFSTHRDSGIQLGR